MQKLAPDSEIGREEQVKITPNTVKELLLLGVINDIPENYENLKIIWEKLELNSLKKFMALDLKLANISVGIQNHGSLYPSHICECRRPDKKSGTGYTKGPLRTLKSCRENAKRYREDLARNDAKKSDSPKYKNCINQPLFDDHGDTPIIMLIPPSELHLFTGPTNHLYKVSF